MKNINTFFRGQTSLLDWLERVQSQYRRPSTALSYNALKTHLIIYLGNNKKARRKRLSHIGPDFCDGFINYLSTARNLRANNTSRTLAPATQKKIYTQFESLFNKAVNAGILKTDPCKHVAASAKPRAMSSERNYLTQEELIRLKATPCHNPIVKNAFLFSCYAGLRWSDIKTLDWQDITMNDSRWYIVKRMVKTGEWVFLPLNDTAFSFLPPRKEIGLVFPLPTPPSANATIRAWCQVARISKKITFHCARHTFATLLFTLGADIYTTSQLLGHKSLSSTQVYARVVDEKKNRAVRLLDAIAPSSIVKKA